MGRRDTLKLASAAAALGAGLGVVLKAVDAAAQPVAAGQLQHKDSQPGGLQQIKIDGVMKLEAPQQSKIDGYQKLAPQKGQVQFKIGTTGGQLLFAAVVPDDIANLLFSAPAGQLQFKFYRPASIGTALQNEGFKEGLMQFTPSTPSTPSAPAPAPTIRK